MYKTYAFNRVQSLQCTAVVIRSDVALSVFLFVPRNLHVEHVVLININFTLRLGEGTDCLLGVSDAISTQQEASALGVQVSVCQVHSAGVVHQLGSLLRVASCLVDAGLVDVQVDHGGSVSDGLLDVLESLGRVNQSVEVLGQEDVDPQQG